MPKIASSHVEAYIRQLLSETLCNDVDPQNHNANERVLKDEQINLTNRKLNDESKDK
jgi:hypothetical protein